MKLLRTSSGITNPSIDSALVDLLGKPVGDASALIIPTDMSGLAELLPALRETVYVGVSAGSIAATTIFGQTFINPPQGSAEILGTEDVVFETPASRVDRILVTARGMDLVDFALMPHLNHGHHEDASLANAEKRAAHIPAPTYAIDDQTAIKVVDGEVEVVSEGHWKLFTGQGEG